MDSLPHGIGQNAEGKTASDGSRRQTFCYGSSRVDFDSRIMSGRIPKVRKGQTRSCMVGHRPTI